MTLKEQKTAIETAVQQTIKNNLAENVQINVFYNLEEGVITVNLQTSEENNNIHNIAYYRVAYHEEHHKIAISAFQRSINNDFLGPVAVINNPIAIDEDFLMNMKQLIEVGINTALNPQPEDTDKQASE